MLETTMKVEFEDGTEKAYGFTFDDDGREAAALDFANTIRAFIAEGRLRKAEFIKWEQPVETELEME